MPRPVLAADDCRREPHDYAGSSFFGRRGPHPEMEHGRTVLAATVRVGRGQIAAFTDSTVWSSFAVFSHDREKLAMDLVRLLESASRAHIRRRSDARRLAVLIAGCWWDSGWLGWAWHLPAPAVRAAGFWSGAGGGRSPSPIDLRLAGAQKLRFRKSLSSGREALRVSAGARDAGITAGRPLFRHAAGFGSAAGAGAADAYTYDEDFLTPDTRAIFVVAPVNAPPRTTMAD